MDALGILFLISFLMIIIISIVLFQKRLKKIGINHFKYKLIHFIICIVIPISIIFFYALLITSPYLINSLNLRIDLNNFTYRIIFASIIFSQSILVNIFISKIYLKRISKTKNEIELIGKE